VPALIARAKQELPDLSQIFGRHIKAPRNAFALAELASNAPRRGESGELTGRGRRGGN